MRWGFVEMRVYDSWNLRGMHFTMRDFATLLGAAMSAVVLDSIVNSRTGIDVIRVLKPLRPPKSTFSHNIVSFS